MLSAQTRMSVESAITASPPTSHCLRPIRSTSGPTTRTKAYMPTMCTEMTVKTSVWWWPLSSMR